MADKRSAANVRGKGQSPEPKQRRQAPVFEARRVDTEPKLRKNQVDLPSPGVWHWLGDEATLGRYEIDGKAGDRVVPKALGRARRGHGAKSKKLVRRPANLTKGGKSTSALRCVMGVYEPAAGLAGECRSAVTDQQKDQLRERLLAEAGTGIQQLAGTGRFAAAAKVSGLGEGEDGVVRVEWIAFGAERGKNLGSPYDNRRARNFDAGVAKVSSYVAKAFGDEARHAGREARQAGPEAKGDARLPGVLGSPVRDSLGAKVEVIGVNAAQNIKARAERKAKQHRLDRLPEGDLRRLLESAENPFDKIPTGPAVDGEALGKWWSDHSDRIVLTTAIEGTLIAKKEKEFADLAKREVARRGELSPAPLGAVRQARGKRFAAEVGRRAAVRTGELASLTEKERMARTRELHEKVKDVGLRGAEVGDVADSVALQNLRNAHNEHEVRMLEEKGQRGRAAAREPERNVPGAAMGID